MKTLLQILTSVLGPDHDLVKSLTDAKPGDTPVEYGTDTENEALQALASVDDDTLSAVQAAFREAAKDDNTPADQIPAMMDAYKGVQFVLDARAEQTAADQALRDEALATMEPPAAEPDADLVALDEAGLGGVTLEDLAALNEPAAEEPAVEPVMASIPSPSIRNVANRVPVPAKPAPTPEAFEAALDEPTARFALADGQATKKFARGDLLTRDEVAEVIVSRGKQMGNSGGDSTRETYTVASAMWEYPEDRTLTTDPAHNEDIITAAVALAQQGFSDQDAALMASVCAMPTPLYDIPTIASAVRPVKDFLTSFGADRGGVIFRPGMSLSSAGAVNNVSSGVTSGWSDGDADKFLLTVDCPTTETATVESIVARASVSNMQGRFDPESVAARLRIQEAFWARVAEDYLLDAIDTGSTSIGPDITLIIGFTRQFLQSLNTAAAGIRNRERMDKDAQLDVLAPAWFINAMQDDLSFEQPGATAERLAATQADIEEYLRVRNIRIGWFLDGSNIGDLFLAQSAGANITDYPQQPHIFIFEPGHHLFLDGGELNLGIIRDSVTSATNRYQTFYETFEQIASRGVVSYDIQVNVCRTGTTGAAAEITCGEVS